MSKAPVVVNLEFTPNPNTLKYMVNRQFLEKGAANYRSKQEAESGSPLAVGLFSIAGVSGVMIGRNFITVTKTEEGDWDEVHQKSSSLIEVFLEGDHPVLSEGGLKKLAQASSNPQDSKVESMIISILDNEIRPAVAMDGGDIAFVRYDDGIVYLQLQGACAGCPGATMTLKMGVENRLREAIPEIKEVVSV